LSRASLLASVSILFSTATLAAGAPNWTANYPACRHHDELLKTGPLNVGVRILTNNVPLAQQFERALDYWSSILDLAWHNEDSADCTIQVLDGKSDLFATADRCRCISARAQFPDQPGFEGWIAFNPGMKLNAEDLYRLSVHEIGHLLGLGHSSSPRSVMYFFDVDSPIELDTADLRALAAKHKLRNR